MSEMNPNLIVDLARLALRYSPEDWMALSHLLQDEESRARVALMLDELAEASGRARKRSGTKTSPSATKPNTRNSLAQLRKTDPESAELLSDLWTKLRSRELLADMASIRAFSEAVGMKTLSSEKREQAASEIIRHLISLPREAIDVALGRTKLHVDRNLGQEYEQWVGLILNRDNLP